MKKLMMLAPMFAVVALTACADVTKATKPEASLTAPTASTAAIAATEVALSAKSTLKATTPSTNGVPTQADDNQEAVITAEDYINGIAVQITPHDSAKKHGCASKYNGLLGAYEIMTYNGYVITQHKKRQLIEKMKLIPISTSSQNQNQGWTADCFDWKLQQAKVSAAPVSASTPAPAPTKVSVAKMVAPAVVEPAKPAAESVAAAPAAAPVKKVVKKGPPDFYVTYIKKSDYSVKGWQKKHCINADGKIGKETIAAIDAEMGKTGVDPCEEEKDEKAPADPAAKKP